MVSYKCFINFQLVKKHKIGQLPVVDWLDRLAFLEIEVINEIEKKNSNFFHLMIEFPFIEVNSVPVSKIIIIIFFYTFNIIVKEF